LPEVQRQTGCDDVQIDSICPERIHTEKIRARMQGPGADTGKIKTICVPEVSTKKREWIKY
jgi:hypothetical protein